MALASAEHEADAAARDEAGDSADNADATRDAQRDKPARSGS
ncbi:hypothetical protein LFL96_18385 [Paraburkholderia sp. D15]|nr:hypothetical protein [Paraburkholderia sp. D15]WGS49690.1 hypothetical protein LFL96_18385 [Paraburkholderia sp. D15]